MGVIALLKPSEVCICSCSSFFSRQMLRHTCLGTSLEPVSLRYVPIFPHWNRSMLRLLVEMSRGVGIGRQRARGDWCVFLVALHLHQG